MAWPLETLPCAQPKRNREHDNMRDKDLRGGYNAIDGIRILADNLNC